MNAARADKARTIGESLAALPEDAEAAWEIMLTARAELNEMITAEREARPAAWRAFAARRASVPDQRTEGAPR